MHHVFQFKVKSSTYVHTYNKKHDAVPLQFLFSLLSTKSNLPLPNTYVLCVPTQTQTQESKYLEPLLIIYSALSQESWSH